MIALLKHEPRYPAMGLAADTVLEEDEGELNELLRGPYKSPTLAEVRDRLRRTHESWWRSLIRWSLTICSRPTLTTSPKSRGTIPASRCCAG